MQNSKCKMQNCGVLCEENFKIMRGAHTIILHSAFCILHSSSAQNAFHIVKTGGFAFHKPGSGYGAVGQHGTAAGLVL